MKLTRCSIRIVRPILIGQEENCDVNDIAHPGYLGSQDSIYVETFKGVGRVCQQTYVRPTIHIIGSNAI